MLPTTSLHREMPHAKASLKKQRRLRRRPRVNPQARKKAAKKAKNKKERRQMPSLFFIHYEFGYSIHHKQPQAKRLPKYYQWKFHKPLHSKTAYSRVDLSPSANSLKKQRKL